jgi:uncharacterized protein with ATP-grasp and redox domains
MISDYRCVYCLVRSYGNRLEKADMPAEAKEQFTQGLLKVLNDKWYGISAPDCARDIQELYRSVIDDPDPFKEVKRVSNDNVLEMYDDLEKRVRDSDNPFITAVKLAIAGNIIDFAVHDSCDLPGTIEKALASDFAVDHSRQLEEALLKAKKVLYIGDNAGEIVFDKLLIKEIGHPGMTYSVRGAPVINDATMDDAEYIGMTSVTRVISSGYDAPSTVVSRSGNEFRKVYEEADLIISKGQGNLEGLIGENDSRIFFLLMVKCDVIAEYLRVAKGSCVVYNEMAAKTDDKI